MSSEILFWIVVATLIAASTTIILNNDWRISLGALGAQYIGVFLLVTYHMPFIMGAVKLITGWMVVTVLGITRLGLTGLEHEKDTSSLPGGLWFRLILAGIIALAVGSSTARIEEAIPGLGLPVISGALFLIGSGVLQISITADMLRITLGLLTMLAGFEIVYAAVESSILVTGLLAATNLGLGLTGSYLLTAGTFPPEEEEES